MRNGLKKGVLLHAFSDQSGTAIFDSDTSQAFTTDLSVEKLQDLNDNNFETSDEKEQYVIEVLQSKGLIITLAEE